MDSKKLEPFELLEAGRIDVIFAAQQSRVNCDWTPLYYDAMYAILPEDYPVGGRELSHRDGDGQAGVFLRQAESTDDANGTENAALPLR